MTGVDQPADGEPSKAAANQGPSKDSDNAPAMRRGKAASGRGPPPKRKKPDGGEKAETSKGAGKRQKQEKNVQDSDDIRNRASPFRLATVNDMLLGSQKIKLIENNFGGLLNIANSMPVDLSQWVMRCYDPVKSELVIPERGRIPVDAESVSLMWGVPCSGLKVHQLSGATIHVWSRSFFRVFSTQARRSRVAKTCSAAPLPVWM